MRAIRYLLQSCVIVASFVVLGSVSHSEPARETIYIVINADTGRSEIGTEEYAMKQCRFWGNGKGTCQVAKTCSQKGYAGVVRAPSGTGFWMQGGCFTKYDTLKSALLESCRRNGFSGCEIAKTHPVR